MPYEVHDGYQKFRSEEPLVLEPKDWTSHEWAAICKMFDLPLGQTERIVLHASEIECLIDLNKNAMDSERTYTVTELCPHCESEVEMRWDTDTLGFKAFCPVCGNRLMLCDECRHTESPCSCDYDNQTGICHRDRSGDYPELAKYDEENHILDITRDDPVEDGPTYEVVFDVKDERYYCYLYGTESLLEAVGLFFSCNPNITYEMIIEHLEV